MSLERLMRAPEQETKLREDLTVLDLGILDYHKALDMQERLLELRNRNKIPDTVIMLEHPHVYTLGKDVKEDEVSNLVKEKLDAEVIQVQRGGKITYHGPGQLVVYFICRMPFKDYGKFLTQVEEVGIAALRAMRIEAYSRKEEIDPRYGTKGIKGAWYNLGGIPKKVVAQGLEFRRSQRQDKEDSMVVTMHGFAMNVNTDLAYFQKIHPCGFNYDVMSSMKEITGTEIDMEKVKSTVKDKLREKLVKWS